MAVDLPIFFLGDGSKETTDRVQGSPCIRITVFGDPNPKPGQNYPSINTWALLDTGADHFYVDTSILADLGSRPGRQIAANGLPTFVHTCALQISDAGFAFCPQEVAARDIRSEGQPFRVILGRRFFEFATLNFDIGAGQSPTLRFYGRRERVAEGQDT